MLRTLVWHFSQPYTRQVRRVPGCQVTPRREQRPAGGSAAACMDTKIDIVVSCLRQSQGPMRARVRPCPCACLASCHRVELRMLEEHRLRSHGRSSLDQSCCPPRGHARHPLSQFKPPLARMRPCIPPSQADPHPSHALHPSARPPQPITALPSHHGVRPVLLPHRRRAPRARCWPPHRRGAARCAGWLQPLCRGAEGDCQVHLHPVSHVCVCESCLCV